MQYLQGLTRPLFVRLNARILPAVPPPLLAPRLVPFMIWRWSLREVIVALVANMDSEENLELHRKYKGAGMIVHT